MFVVSAAIGEMIIPLIVGKVFDYVGAISFLAEGCILCFAAFGAYLAVLIIGKGTASHERKREGINVCCLTSKHRGVLRSRLVSPPRVPVNSFPGTSTPHPFSEGTALGTRKYWKNWFFGRRYTHSSPRKQPTLRDATIVFPTKWRLRNERRNSILMTRHYSDLGSASNWLMQISHAAPWPIRSTTPIWVVKRHQYGISGLVSQSSICGETSGCAVLRNVGCFLKLRRRRKQSIREKLLGSRIGAH